MSEAPITEQPDVELTVEEVVRRTEDFQDRLIEGLKSRPEAVDSSLTKFVKGPNYSNDIVLEEGGVKFDLFGYSEGPNQRLTVTVSGLGNVDIDYIIRNAVKHVTFTVYADLQYFKNTPRAFEMAESFLSPILSPRKA